MEGIADYEKSHGIPHNYVNVAMCVMCSSALLDAHPLPPRVARGREGAFQRLERGELPLPEFYRLFESELGDATSRDLYSQYCATRGLPTPAPLAVPHINARELFHHMMAVAATPNPLMLRAVVRLKGSRNNKKVYFVLTIPQSKASLSRH